MHKLTLVAAVLCFGFTPSLAFAVSKTLPGSACQADFEYQDGLIRGTNNAGRSFGTNSMVCSLVRDTANNTSGLAALQFRVNKADSNTRTCTAYSVDGFGNVLKSVNRSVSGTGVKVFDWTNTLNTSSTTAAYNIRCALGQSDFALGLYYDEPAPAFGPDAKVVPGQYCKSTLAPYPMMRYPESLGGLAAQSIVECAPLRDSFSTAGSISAMTMRVKNASGELGCDGIIADSHENYITSVLRDATVIGNNTLSWGTTLNTPNVVNAHFGIECFIYGSSDLIYNIRWEE